MKMDIAGKPQQDKALDYLDLQKALSEFERDPTKKAAIMDAILAETDLVMIPDEELERTDATAQARRVYVLSYLRLLSTLRKPSASPGEELEKAKLSLAYIKHVESDNLAALRIGRTTGDDTFVKEVQQARQRLAQISDTKAKLITEKQDEATKPEAQTAPAIK